MPITAAPIKVEAVKRLGGIIELVGETYAEAQTYAQVGGCPSSRACLKSSLYVPHSALRSATGCSTQRVTIKCLRIFGVACQQHDRLCNQVR